MKKYVIRFDFKFTLIRGNASTFIKNLMDQLKLIKKVLVIFIPRYSQ